ncbi:nucleoside-diphosphate-sugar epimerase [Candidatus Omnitrophus magneticus]|uniref:Nucleoside-diphosphate-sugar epimerase n=1 Tax=Candidatus Omnitrophus magneticus TaxID=1609969 RepID=A0A0F0CMN1_9BACT|nr:nucleoside-diphosphate-sugar epimerase [Candidatus Omnitrophus magneticus]
MRILITGGAGFIASHLIDKLIAEGHNIIAVDNFITGSRDNVAHLKGNKSFELIEQDVSICIPECGKIDYVMHLASPASPVDYITHPIETMKVGSFATYNALEYAKKYNAKFFVSSTSEVYGDPLITPQDETYLGNVSCIGPRSVYDEAKRFAEAMTMAYHRQFKLDTKIVRIFNTYGERMRIRDGRVVPNFIDQALKGESLTVYGKGEQTRSFCYVSDLTDGIIKLMKSNLNEPVNLGNTEEMTILDFAKKIKKFTGSSSEIIFNPLPADDPKQRRPDIRKAKEKLGWVPKVTLDEGLTGTIKWFKEKMRGA